MSYDGMLDPLGQSQVLSYLLGLSRLGYRFDLLSFEKPERWQAERAAELTEELADRGIRWMPLRYHRKFSALATAYDLSHGIARALRPPRSVRYPLVHARSYPSAVVAAAVASATGAKFLFDIRGLYPEERVEGGIWAPASPLFRGAKRIERTLFARADAVVTLTHASVGEVQRRVRDSGGSAPVEVIPTCADLERFAPLGGGKANVLAYVGSVGTWYQLDEMCRFARTWVAQVPDGRVRFLVNGELDRVWTGLLAAGVPGDRVEVRSVSHDRVAANLVDVAATMAFVRPTFSKIASAATKVGESLAMGVPVVTTPRVGDADQIVRRDRVGVVVEDASDDGLAEAVRELRDLLTDPELARRCRASAEAHFSLEAGVASYARLYQSLGVPPSLFT